MILDTLLMFNPPSLPWNGAQTNATYVSDNVVDLGLAQPAVPSYANGGGARDLGVGDNPALKMLVQVSTAFTSGSAATLQLALQGAPDDGTGAPGTFDTYWLSPAYALAALTAGARLYDMDLPRPPQGVEMPRFLRMTYIIGVAAMTAGGLISGIVIDRMDQPYAPGTDNTIMSGYRAGINVAN